MMFLSAQPIRIAAIALTLEMATLLNPLSLHIAANAQPQSGQPPQAGQTGQERSHPRPPRPDFAAAAQKLGTTEAKLVDALGLPPKPPEPTHGDRPQGKPPRLDIAGAAKKLNVSEADLVKALNLPAHPPGDHTSDRSQPDSSR